METTIPMTDPAASPTPMTDLFGAPEHAPRSPDKAKRNSGSTQSQPQRSPDDAKRNSGPNSPDTGKPGYDLTSLVVPLLKSVLYRDDDPALWATLLELQARVRDHVAVLALDLVLDESEGYAFLKARPDPEDEAAPKPPRLVARRPLSFQLSLLLALLRKKLVEFDASGGDTRLVLPLEAVVELVRVFSPVSSNEVRLMDQVQTQLNKLIELGFVRKLKVTSTRATSPDYEVQRILKAFVDAQWLSDFDARLAAYQAHLAQDGGQDD